MANYEVKLEYVIQDKGGNDKKVKETFLVENMASFGNAETAVLNYWNCECDILAVSLSKVMEVLNYPTSEEKEESKIFKVVLIQTFTDDNGEEKDSKYTVALWAKDLESAMLNVKEYIKQGYGDMSIHSITKSKIREII
ncbi:MAG: DUF4494 family protein [Alphaproteobacteria bacterium]